MQSDSSLGDRLIFTVSTASVMFNVNFVSTSSMSAGAAFFASMAVALMMHVFIRVDWVFVDGNGVNLLLHDDWVGNFDWDFDGIGNFDFFDDGDLDDLDFRHLLVVMLVDGVDWNLHASDVVFRMTASMTAGNWDCASCGDNTRQSN